MNIQGAPLNINGEFHLLGLGLKQISSSLTDLIEEIINNRLERNQEIIKKIQADGFDLTLEEMQADFPNTVLGRPHFAAELVKKKIVKTRQAAFDKYLAKGRPWYVTRIGADLDNAIEAIKDYFISIGLKVYLDDDIDINLLADVFSNNGQYVINDNERTINRDIALKIYQLAKK